MKLNKVFQKLILLLIYTMFIWSCDTQKIVNPNTNLEVVSVCLGDTTTRTISNPNSLRLTVDTNPNCNQAPALHSADTDKDPNANFSASNVMYWNSSNPLCASVNPTKGSSTILTIQNNGNQECSTIVTANFNNQITTFNFTINLNPVSIGGTVSGLAGTGLVLQNNGGDNLSISANGAFTFTTPIAIDSSYAVTVFTQPSSPTQTCTVTNGSGTVSNVDVTDVSITCTTNTYTIGGSVSGLSDSGLVLQNAGGNNLSISANGAFTFTTPIASGGSYAVTVSTQPSTPTQTCTVTNGSGTVTNANITNVSIACTTNTYTIGGSVSGLSGSGLVLQNNGGNNLSISANGTFTFTTPIASGGNYAVTVFIQPSSPTQTCTVTNGSGTVTNANVTNISVVCTNDITLAPASNVAVSGTTVTLTYNTTSQANGFSLVFNIGGGLSFTCSDVSIAVPNAYGLVTVGSTFSSSSSMPQYSCSKSGSNITLSAASPLLNGFHPWVDSFEIKFSTTTTFSVSVQTSSLPAPQLLTRGIQSAMNLNSSFPGCGLSGTVLQRVFDCSKMIINYAVYVDPTNSGSGSSVTNPDGTSAYYTLFTNPSVQNSDLFWFVVSCPAGTGGAVPQQSCHWLTPVVPNDNPALDSTGAGTYPTFQLALFNSYQNRLLLSGKMTNSTSGYAFSAANGFLSTDAQVYAVDNTNPGVIPTTAQPTPTPASVCNAASGGSLLGGGTLLSADASVRDLISTSSGATISWQMPSYAMLTILTGGTATQSGAATPCPASGLYDGFNRPNCDYATTLGGSLGFSAVNVPGFAMTDSAPAGPPLLEFLLTSSAAVGGATVWSFLPLYATAGGYIDGNGPAPNAQGVRCTSLAWY